MALEFNLTRLDEVFKSYHTVTNCRVAIFDEDGLPIISYPRDVCGVCKVLRTFETVDQKCYAMDMAAFKKARQTKEIYIYECEMGLYDAVSPILQDDKVIGYIMLGQLVDEKNKEKVIQKCLPYFESRAALEHMLAGSESLNLDKLRASAVLISVCAEYLCLTKDLKQKQKHIFMVMKDYIAKNADQKITVGLLCKRFGISRTALFKLFAEMEGVGVMQSVNNTRMEKAKDLLCKTGLPVSAVAELAGFADSNYFTRIFKKNFAVTPLAYRKEHRLYA